MGMKLGHGIMKELITAEMTALKRIAQGSLASHRGEWDRWHADLPIYAVALH
jgi:hypothetical protein